MSVNRLGRTLVNRPADIALGIGLEDVQAVLGAEVEGLAGEVAARPPCERSTFIPQTGSVAPRRDRQPEQRGEDERAPTRLRTSL